MTWLFDTYQNMNSSCLGHGLVLLGDLIDADGRAEGDVVCYTQGDTTWHLVSTVSHILQGGETLNSGVAVQLWRKETPGTCSHPSLGRTLEPIKWEIETYVLVFPGVAFSLENMNVVRNSGPVVKVPRLIGSPLSATVLSATSMAKRHIIIPACKKMFYLSNSCFVPKSNGSPIVHSSYLPPISNSATPSSFMQLFLGSAIPRLFTQQWPLLNLNNAQTWFDTWREERGDRAIGVLDYRSPTATMFYTAETLQDELLTIKHCCIHRSPQYAALVQCSQASSDEAYDDTDSKKGPPYNKRSSGKRPFAT
ncbi:hypothetical protein ARMGADRAFT_1136619 [Armillaria gallica]|uniref:Uncharacterized protein n=1 Tax=Armillaria gallica TaxID=47427 RepID=A0A2H3CYW5_ARMGA|nr:hypothetical protein ARMGADRAFT_1136619 [Armillaria gallica]